MVAPLYREKYVAFIDMLGFSNLVLCSASDDAKKSRILEAIERLKDTACPNPATGMIITYFSDCIVLSSDRSPRGLVDMLDSIRVIAENLLVVDMLVRGGLTVGAIHHDSQFMFGPAMIEAYQMESKQAVHPTILVSAKVGADVDALGVCERLVHDDADPKRRYVNYLISFADYDPTPRAGTVILEGPAMLVRHYIARRLSQDTGKPLAKAQWLERYWNEIVGSKGVLGNVDQDSDRLAPTGAHPFRSRMFIAGKS